MKIWLSERVEHMITYMHIYTQIFHVHQYMMHYSYMDYFHMEQCPLHSCHL